MVMPFGVKATGLGPSDDGPTTKVRSPIYVESNRTLGKVDR